MVFPFAIAIGVGMTLGLLGVPILWVLASGAGCAGLYMWNTRSPARQPGADIPDANRGGAPLLVAAMTFAGLITLMVLVGGAGHLMGSFFRWARLDA